MPAWLRWGAVNLGVLAAVMAAGLVLLIPPALAGWGDADTGVITYLYLWLYLPLTGPLYLLVLRRVAPRVRRPRGWAIALAPLLFGLFPVAVIAITLPGVAATWIAYFAYGAVVRLPPAAH
ncbi:MAG TPA: hypothetical protein VF533_11820 [Solirubrobacteraceae bacterium]